MKIEKLKFQMNKNKLKLKDEYSFKWNPNFIQGFFTQISLGVRGAGKSYSALEFLNEIKDDYDIFYVISPTLQGDQKQRLFFENLEKNKIVLYYNEFDKQNWEDIEHNIDDNIKLYKKYKNALEIVKKYKSKTKLTDEEILFLNRYLWFDDFNIEDILNEYPDYIKNENPPRSMIFMDDVYGSPYLSKSMGGSAFTNFYIRHRHKFASIMMLFQSYLYIPRTIRLNTILWILFSQKDKRQINNIFDELGGCFDTKEDYLEIMEALKYRNQHDFLYLDCSNMKKPDIRFNFDEKIIFNQLQ